MHVNIYMIRQIIRHTHLSIYIYICACVRVCFSVDGVWLHMKLNRIIRHMHVCMCMHACVCVYVCVCVPMIDVWMYMQRNRDRIPNMRVTETKSITYCELSPISLLHLSFPLCQTVST